MANVETPDSIEADIEATRARLAGTIDTLVYRASPRTMVRREMYAVRGYFVDPQGQPRTENILKVVGGVVGVVTLMVVLRRITR